MQIARTAGLNLTYNAALLCLSMCRKLIYFWGKNSYLSRILPLDVVVPYHKILGCMTVLWTIIHAGVWIDVACRKGALDLLYPNSWAGNTAGETGVALIVILLAIVAGYAAVYYTPSFGSTLARCNCISKVYVKNFIIPHEVFGYTHSLLAIGYLLVLIAHAPQVWKILCGPLFLLLCEYIHRLYCASEEVTVVVAEALPGNDTKIEITRPKSFGEWKPGSWAFVNIPSISTHEWHPFTIASSHLHSHQRVIFHIRSQGAADSWTSKLRAMCNNTENKMYNSIAALSTDDFEKAASEQEKLGLFTARLDGPYYAPTQKVFNHHHSVLVCGGIGVTPSISIF